MNAAAVRFARAYLEDPSPEALRPFLAAGARIGAGRPPSARGAEVAQAEVVKASEVGDGRVVVTVACELRDSRTLYLAVPIVRFAAGEVAVLGAPSIVAVPAVAGADPERPRPFAGSEAGAIEALVAKFLPAYLSASRESDLSYLLAPGARSDPARRLGAAARRLWRQPARIRGRPHADAARRRPRARPRDAAPPTRSPTAWKWSGREAAGT